MCTSVKFHRKYYDDCAQILTEHMLAARKPKSKVSFSALAPLLATMEDPVDFWGGKSNNKKKKQSREDDAHGGGGQRRGGERRWRQG